MYRFIYIADNNTDLTDIPIAEYSSTEEAPKAPVENASQDEMSAFLNKSFTAFGALVFCIVIFLVCALWYKKRLSKQENSYVYETEDECEEIDDEEEIPAVKSSPLNTPSNLNKCIRTFLENTKNL